MEGNSTLTPLLENQNHNLNSFNSVTTTFLSKLSDKVHSLVIHTDSSFHFDSHSSTSTTLSQGLILSFSHINNKDYYEKYWVFNWSTFIGEKEYYERQFATLKSFEEVDSLVTSDSVDADDREIQTQHERAMKISNFANIILLALKVLYYIFH